MEQDEFTLLLEQAFEGMTPEQMDAIAHQIQDMRVTIFLEEKLRGYFKCEVCGKFSLLSEYTIKEEEEPVTEGKEEEPCHMKKRMFICPKCGEIGYEGEMKCDL